MTTAARRIGSFLLAVALLGPGLFVTSFVVLFLLTIFTGALASVHPGAVVIVPLLLGVGFSFWGHDVKTSLGRRWRMVLAFSGLAALIAAVVIFDTQCGGLRCESNSPRSAVPAWSFLVGGAIAATAGALGSRRLALILVGGLVLAAAELAFLALLVLLWALLAPFGYV